MKRFLLILLVSISLTSCSVSKITSRAVVSKAQDGQKVAFDSYVNNKLEICKYLAPDENQKTQLKNHFIEEKTELDKIVKDDSQMIARNIYKYEMGFRKILNKEQLKMYKKMRNQFEDKFFYSQHSINSIHKSVMSI